MIQVKCKFWEETEKMYRPNLSAVVDLTVLVAAVSLVAWNFYRFKSASLARSISTVGNTPLNLGAIS